MVVHHGIIFFDYPHKKYQIVLTGLLTTGGYQMLPHVGMYPSPFPKLQPLPEVMPPVGVLPESDIPSQVRSVS